MTNEGIIAALLNLLRNGVDGEKEAAVKAVVALTIALETIPSKELRLELELVRDYYELLHRDDLVALIDTAQKYPYYQWTRIDPNSGPSN